MDTRKSHEKPRSKVLGYFAHSRVAMTIIAVCAALSLTEYLSRGRVLRDDVDHVLGGHHLVEPDDGGVVQQLHHLHLALHLLQVHRVQLRLVDDLDRHLKCKG